MAEQAAQSSESVAILGLGEAGKAIAADLVARGVRVAGWDPVMKEVPGVHVAENAAAAVTGARIVMSVNAAKVAVEVAREVAPHLREGQIFADLNSGSPGLKDAVAAEIAPSGALFVDVALMSPVPGRGLATPSLASGPGVAAFLATMQPLGMAVDGLDERTGRAATHKLLRSVFMKGVHAAFLEGFHAAERLGMADWYRAEVARTFEEMGAGTVDRIVTGSRLHAARRTEEMLAVADLLREAGVEPRVTLACVEILRELQKASP